MCLQTRGWTTLRTDLDKNANTADDIVNESETEITSDDLSNDSPSPSRGALVNARE